MQQLISQVGEWNCARDLHSCYDPAHEGKMKAIYRQMFLVIYYKKSYKQKTGDLQGKMANGCCSSHKWIYPNFWTQSVRTAPLNFTLLQCWDLYFAQSPCSRRLLQSQVNTAINIYLSDMMKSTLASWEYQPPWLSAWKDFLNFSLLYCILWIPLQSGSSPYQGGQEAGSEDGLYLPSWSQSCTGDHTSLSTYIKH